MNLTHFSPYFMYDSESTGLGESETQPSMPGNSNGPSGTGTDSDFNDETVEDDLESPTAEKEVAGNSSIIGDIFVTGDSKTKIIAWCSVGLIIMALGILVFMKKYKNIK